MQTAEEERRVIMDMTSVDMENNRINSENLVCFWNSNNKQTALKKLSIDQITNRLFFFFATWLIRESDSHTFTESVSSSGSCRSNGFSGFSESGGSSGSTFKTFSELRDLHKKQRTVSDVSTLHDSSIGVDSEERSETSTFHSSRYERESRALQKIRVMGHVDYENCLRDLLPRCSKSQCVTRANRLFEKVRKEC